MKNSTRYRGAVLWNFVSDYFKDFVVLSNFTERSNLIPHLGISDLLVHKNYKLKYKVILHRHTFTFKSDYPFDVFYTFLFEG